MSNVKANRNPYSCSTVPTRTKSLRSQPDPFILYTEGILGKDEKLGEPIKKHRLRMPNPALRNVPVSASTHSQYPPQNNYNRAEEWGPTMTYLYTKHSVHAYNPST